MTQTVLSKALRSVIARVTGHIGRLLAAHFHAQGHKVTAVARHTQPAAWPVLLWDSQSLGDWLTRSTAPTLLSTSPAAVSTVVIPKAIDAKSKSLEFVRHNSSDRLLQRLLGHPTCG